MINEVEQAGKSPKVVSEQPFFVKVEEKSGKIKHSWSGTRVSFLGRQIDILFIELHHLAWFRLFVGDLSNDVSDDVLSNAFNKYASFQKARVIRDRLSQKVSSLFLLLKL